MTEIAQTCMPMNNLDLFSNDDVSEYWEEREDRWHCRLSIDDEERDMVDFESIGEVAYSSTTRVCMSDDDDFVTTVDEFLEQMAGQQSIPSRSLGLCYSQLTAGRCDSQLLLTKFSLRRPSCG